MLDFLVKAAANGHKRIVNFLLALGVNSNQCDRGGHTALMMSSMHNHKAIVKLLLSNKNVDINKLNAWNQNALMLAAFYGNIEIVKLLIGAGSDLEQKDEKGNTAVMLAAKMGDTKSVKELLAVGADIHQKNVYGVNALMLAAENGYIEIVKELLAAGADANQKSTCGINALMLVMVKGYKELAKCILDHNLLSDPNFNLIEQLSGCNSLFILEKQLNNYTILIQDREASKKALIQYWEGRRRQLDGATTVHNLSAAVQDSGVSITPSPDAAAVALPQALLHQA